MSHKVATASPFSQNVTKNIVLTHQTNQTDTFQSHHTSEELSENKQVKT